MLLEMKIQLALQDERLTADFATVGSFSRVQANVSYEGRPPEEALSAVWAQMALHFVMQFTVYVQCGGSRERFGTNATGIGPFTRVASDMDSKLLVGVESFATELATVRFFPGMPPHMQLQV